MPSTMSTGAPAGPGGMPSIRPAPSETATLSSISSLATHRSSGRSLDIAVTIGALSPEEVERATRVVHGLMVTG